MQKPVYYLWKRDFNSEEEYLGRKAKYSRSGFRVVTFTETNNENQIHQALKKIIKNHL